MRIDKAIENIQAAIDRHQDEWLKENGYEPEPHIRRTRTEQPKPAKKTSSASLPANRFLGSSQQNDNNVEVVEVIKQKDSQHSWLYNEVLKAINDAAGNRKNTKVIAVFIPVVQNGSEFKDLPVNETVTLSEVSEDDINADIHAEDLTGIAAAEPEENLDALEDIMLDTPVEESESGESESVETEANEPEEFEQIAEAEAEPQQENDLLENVMLEPHEEEEIAEIFGDMEEKLDEQQIQEEQENAENSDLDSETIEFIEPEEPEESIQLETLEVPEEGFESEISEFPDFETITADDEDDFDSGEKLTFSEIPELPELDDDEAFDEAVSESDESKQN